MSILIGEKRGSIVKYYPIFINSNGNNDFNVNEDNKYKYIINKKMLNKSILNFLDI